MKKKTAAVYDYKPTITRTDLKKIFDTLLSDKLTVSEGGTQQLNFEKRFATYHGKKDALMYANDSLALYAILHDLGVQNGDEIIVSSFVESFVVETIFFIGAIPIFVDCQPVQLFMDLDKAKSVFTKKTCALIYSYPFGYGDGVGLREFGQWLAKNNCPMIEDATQALGSTYLWEDKWFPVGGIGDYALFSLSPLRVLTSAKGAVVLVKNRERIPFLSCARGEEGARSKDDQNLFPRLDFAPTELEATLALSQFSILQKNLERRKYIAEQMQQVFSSDGENFFIGLPRGFSTNCCAHAMLLSTYQDKEDVKISFAQANIGGIREVKNLAYLKLCAKENNLFGGSEEQHKKNNLPHTLEVLSRLLILSFPLDVDDAYIKKIVSLLSSLSKMQLLKKK